MFQIQQSAEGKTRRTKPTQHTASSRPIPTTFINLDINIGVGESEHTDSLQAYSHLVRSWSAAGTFSAMQKTRLAKTQQIYVEKRVRGFAIYVQMAGGGGGGAV